MEHNVYFTEDASEMAKKIETKGARHGVNFTLKNCNRKNGVFRYKMKLKGKTREAQLYAIASDIQLKLGLPFFQFSKEGQSLYLYVAEHNIKYPQLLEVLTSQAYMDAMRTMRLPCIVGHNSRREPVIIDILLLLHWLVAGSSGSGKSALLQAIIFCLIASKSPAELNLMLIDVGANDLLYFNGGPHMACRVLREPSEAFYGLKAMENEMESRIRLANTNPAEFNLRPYIFGFVDETPALISAFEDKTLSKLLIETISSLLQRGRHAKIHLVLAAQNPTLQNMKVDLANITTRVALKCAKPNFSEVILGEKGAELLAGNGDMLFKSPQLGGIQHLKGIYISPEDLKWAIDKIKERPLPVDAETRKFVISDVDLRQIETEINAKLTMRTVSPQENSDDKLFAQILLWTLGGSSVSANLINETYDNIGWKLARRFIDRLYSLGIVGEHRVKQARKVLPKCLEDVSTEAIDLLTANGVSEEDISAAFQGC